LRRRKTGLHTKNAPSVSPRDGCVRRPLLTYFPDRLI
jgi:hypothetical protein